MTAAKFVIEDLLSTQEALGTNLMYQIMDDQLVAIELDEDGDEVARYKLKVILEEI